MNAPDDLLYARPLLRLAADASGAGAMPKPDATATIHNPACGDRVTVELAVTGGRITALAHQTQACVLAQASAAVLASQAVGLDRAGLEALSGSVEAMLKGGPALPAYVAFEGAAAHGPRHRCVLLPIAAALKALEPPEPGA